MSTENTKTTEVTASTENMTGNNKKVFGPLGKYAIVAVIMVSIIITTALMLNKQLGSVDEQLAAMESEIAEIHATDSGDPVASGTGESVNKSQDTATAETVVLVEVQEVEVQTADEQLAEVEAIEAQVVATPAAKAPVSTENTASESASKIANETVTEVVISTDTGSNSASTSAAAESEPATQDQAATALTKREQERQARIDAYKLEQKQRMTEMFARIKTLEAQRLDNYRTSQDEQIDRLREQIARQEQLIEALIIRNKEWLEIREASMQRSQSHREEMLDRI